MESSGLREWTDLQKLSFAAGVGLIKTVDLDPADASSSLQVASALLNLTVGLSAKAYAELCQTAFITPISHPSREQIERGILAAWEFNPAVDLAMMATAAITWEVSRDQLSREQVGQIVHSMYAQGEPAVADASIRQAAENLFPHGTVLQMEDYQPTEQMVPAYRKAVATLAQRDLGAAIENLALYRHELTKNWFVRRHASSTAMSAIDKRAPADVKPRSNDRQPNLGMPFLHMPP